MSKIYNFLCVKPYFNVLNSPLRNHEKIQSLGCIFGLRVYYKVINTKNLKLDVQNTCYLITKSIFKTSRILHGQFQLITLF